MISPLFPFCRYLGLLVIIYNYSSKQVKNYELPENQLLFKKNRTKNCLEHELANFLQRARCYKLSLVGHMHTVPVIYDNP